MCACVSTPLLFVSPSINLTFSYSKELVRVGTGDGGWGGPHTRTRTHNPIPVLHPLRISQQDCQPVQSYSRNALNMAAAMKAQKTGLLELRVTVDRWIRVLATLTEDTLTVNPGEVAEEPAKPNPSPSAVGAVNGDPPNLSTSPVPETITNVKRTVRVTKQDVGGLGISIKGRTYSGVAALDRGASPARASLAEVLTGGLSENSEPSTACRRHTPRWEAKFGRHERRVQRLP